MHGFLVQGLRDALCESAVHLSVDDQRVDHVPDVVDADIGANPHLPGLGIHFRGAQMRAVWEREVLRVVGGLGIQVRFHAVGQVVCGEHGEGDFGERDGLLGTRHAEPSGGEFQIVLGAFHHVGRERLGLGDHLLRRLDHRDRSDRQ